jgi:hypothetical protein
VATRRGGEIEPLERAVRESESVATRRGGVGSDDGSTGILEYWNTGTAVEYWNSGILEQ